MKKKTTNKNNIQISSESDDNQQNNDESSGSSGSSSSFSKSEQQKIQYELGKQPSQTTVRFLQELEITELERVAQYTLRKLTGFSIEAIIQSTLNGLSLLSQQKIYQQGLKHIQQEVLKRLIKGAMERVQDFILVPIKPKRKKKDAKQSSKQTKQANKQSEKKKSQKLVKPVQTEVKPPQPQIKMRIVEEQLKPQDSYRPDSSFDHTSDNNQNQNNNQNQSESESDSENERDRESQKKAGGDSSYAHFVVFMQKNYKLIPEPHRRKQMFLRREPIFQRYVTQIKIDNHNDHSMCLPNVGLQSFRKYMKKYHKSQGLKYQQKRNMYRMKIVMGICMKTNNLRMGGIQND